MYILIFYSSQKKFRHKCRKVPSQVSRIRNIFSVRTLIILGYFGNLARNSRQHNDAFKALEKRIESLEKMVEKLIALSYDNGETMKGLQRYLKNIYIYD